MRLNVKINAYKNGKECFTEVRNYDSSKECDRKEIKGLLRAVANLIRFIEKYL